MGRQRQIYNVKRPWSTCIILYIMHGSNDTLVPPDQATRFDKKMKAAGASHTLTLLEGQGHGFRGESREQANRAMYDFFDRHLKPAEQKSSEK